MMVETVTVDARLVAEAIRDACARAALRAHEDAGISGLCHEGRWELALQAIRTLDLTAELERLAADGTRR